LKINPHVSRLFERLLAVEASHLLIRQAVQTLNSPNAGRELQLRNRLGRDKFFPSQSERRASLGVEK
jgi:hypothetical protein